MVRFTGVAQLDPTDSLFQVIGHDFLEEQKKLYGAHGYMPPTRSMKALRR